MHELIYRLVNWVRLAIARSWFGGIYGSSAGKLVRSWLFQGVFYMAPFELFMRMGLEFIVFLIAWWGLGVPGIWSSVLLAAIIHTLFWLFNSHFWALEIRKGRRLVKNKPDDIKNYLAKLQVRSNNCSSLDACYVSGSLVRGSFGVYSDLDVACISKPGIWNRVVVVVFAMRERLIASLERIPLELYCYSFNSLDRISRNERRLVLKGEVFVEGGAVSLIGWKDFWRDVTDRFWISNG